MKSSAIAVAVLSMLTGTAFAQSSVTVYGKIDLALVVDSGNTAGKSVRISSGDSAGSRLGFKGIEDLGGGYKAGFVLETGFCADSAAGAPNFCTGSNQFMGRQAHGDLSGPFGNISAGRQYSLGYLNLVVLDPFATGYAGAASNGDGAGNLVVDTSGSRLNNSFTYVTPNFGGFYASGEFALGETTGNWRAARETGAEVNYVGGPVYVGVTYYNLDNANGVGTSRQVVTGGGTYDFGVVKVHALAQKVTGTPTGAAHQDVLTLLGGVTVPLAGGNALASYIHHDDRSSLNRSAQQWGIGYNYPLSKLTAVYTAFAHIKNENGAVFKVGNGTELGTGDQSFNVGMVHNF